MPMYKTIAGPDLEIQVYSIGRLHHPGDVVRGRVYVYLHLTPGARPGPTIPYWPTDFGSCRIRRTAPTVCPMVTADIRLFGRIKVNSKSNRIMPTIVISIS